MNELETTSAVIDALGGTTKVARITGRKLAAVSNWRDKATFPPATFLVMQHELRGVGKSAPASLWNMVQPPCGVAPEARVA